MSSPRPGLGQNHKQHWRSPGAQAAELHQVWQELCVRERQARDRNRQLLRDFGHLETQLELLWARTDAVRRRKVDYGEFLQRLLLHPRMEAGSPGRVPQHQDWVSGWTLDLPLRSHSGRHLPGPTQWMNHLQYRTWGPHPVSPTQSPEPAAFLASTWAGTRPQPTQTRAHAGAGIHTEDAASSGVRHRHRAASRASRRLLWRGAWEQDSTETACEKSSDRVPRLWCKEKPGGDTTALDKGGSRSWRQEPWGEQAGDDRPEKSQGKRRRRLSVRVRQPAGNRDCGEGAQLKGEGGQVPIQGVGQLEGGEGRSAMGQTQKEEEEEEGQAVGVEGQEREKDEEGNEGLMGRQGGQEAGEKDEEGNGEEVSGGAGEEEEAEGRGSKEGSTLDHVQASANGEEDEEGLVERRGQEEEGLAGNQGNKEEEEGLVWGQKGQEGGEDEEMESEEGLAGGQRREEEEGSKEEEGPSKGLGGQDGTKEEEEEGLVGLGGQEQSEEEEGSKEEEGLPKGLEGQDGAEEEENEEGSEEQEKGRVGWGGLKQDEEEEGSEVEESLPKGLGGQDGAKEEESEQGSEEEEGQVGWGGLKQGKEEEEGSKEEEGLLKGLGDQDGDEEEREKEEEEGVVGWGEQEQGEEEGSEEEEGLVRWGEQEQGEEEGSEEEEGLVRWGEQEQGEEEGSEEEEGLVRWGEQEQGEEEGNEEEEGLEGRQGGQEGGKEEEGSEGPAVGGTEGRVQEEDAESNLVLGALGAGAQEGPGTVEQRRGRGRETHAWDSHNPESPQDLGQLSTWGEEEEEEEKEAESEGDEDIEAALAPQGNATEPRMKRRTSESHEWRRGSQRSSRLEEGSRKVKVVEAPPTSTTWWPRTPLRGPEARSVTGFWGDSEELGAGLETSLRKDRSPDDQDDFYD